MLTYQQAADFLGTRDRRKVAHETWIEWGGMYWVDPDTQERACVALTHQHIEPQGQSIDIRYHDTAVVTIHPDGCYTLRTGGYLTATTMRRIAEYSPARPCGRTARNMGMGDFRPSPYGLPAHPGGPWRLSCGIEFREGMTVDRFGRDVDHINPGELTC